jgi:hypothetical protein
VSEREVEEAAHKRQKLIRRTILLFIIDIRELRPVIAAVAAAAPASILSVVLPVHNRRRLAHFSNTTPSRVSRPLVRVEAPRG